MLRVCVCCACVLNMCCAMRSTLAINHKYKHTYMWSPCVCHNKRYLLSALSAQTPYFSGARRRDPNNCWQYNNAKTGARRACAESGGWLKLPVAIRHDETQDTQQWRIVNGMHKWLASGFSLVTLVILSTEMNLLINMSFILSPTPCSRCPSRY